MREPGPRKRGGMMWGDGGEMGAVGGGGDQVAAGCVLLLAGPVCCVGYGAYLASRIIAAG